MLSSITTAQETYFGKNKVRYKNFDWSYIQTRHFDIYYYEDAYETAKFTATVMESAYVEIAKELNYKIQKEIPVFVYNSHNDFQQTNITQGLLPEGVGGFTEAFKNRIVIPFAGSYEEFRHVLHHELTHAFVYDLIYGKSFSALISRGKLFNLPLWYAEGFAEYSSRHGWDYFSDMFVRDATINNYLAPPAYLGGFLAYKQGQAMIKYIAETYGEDKLGEILKKGKILLTLNKALKEVLGITEQELWKGFSKEMKRRYWPEIALREEADEFSTQLTHARKDGSYFNEKPEFHPDGTKIAIYTDKSDFTEIVLIDAEKGFQIKKLVKGQRSGDLESLHSFVSGMSFSPEGDKIVFVAKSNGDPTLIFYDLEKNKIYDKKKFDFYNILSPKWSPDNKKIAFAALKDYSRDIYVYNIETEELSQITHDRYDDKEVSWLPNSEELIFSSDRPHSTSQMADWEKNIYVDEGAYLPGDFQYGFYNIFRIKINEADKVVELDVGQGPNTFPAVSPDGRKVAFVSNRNGIDNIYVAFLDSSAVYPITDILTGVRSISWSPNSRKIAFSAFNKGAFDIFIIDKLKPKGENNLLANTAFVDGKYNILKSAEELAQLEDSIKADSMSNDTTQTDTLATVIDSLSTDTLATAPDSLSSDTLLAAVVEEEEKTDSLITTETGVYDEGFVFVSDKEETKFDSLLIGVPKDGSLPQNSKPIAEPEYFDERPGPDEEGEYEENKYKTKYTPDFMHATPGYSTFYGFQGQAYFILSDYLGNHQFYFSTDLVNTIDQSNLQVLYFYNKKRTSLGVGLFHSKNFYSFLNDAFFSDRFYGFQGIARYPFSTFTRVDLSVSQYFIDRQYNYDTQSDFYDQNIATYGFKDNSKVTVGELNYIADNVVWGLTGPVNGRRLKLSVSSGVNLFDSKDIQFTSVEFDYRKYWHIKNSFSLAFRVSGGSSFGSTPKLYFIGGTTNWIGRKTYDASVYDVKNLYFADVVTPLRGVPYYELSGDRYGLINAEFRFPLIDYFAMRFPLPLVFSRIQGVMFTDIGSAWSGSDFKGGTSAGGVSRLHDIKMGFGAGVRVNLGFLLLRYDLAWSTDMNSVLPRTTSYFSAGADF